jgi:hypothetical protein
MCFWEKDRVHESDPYTDNGGANKVTLKKAQENFVQFGACQPDFVAYVRRPMKDDVRDPAWSPLK